MEKIENECFSLKIKRQKTRTHSIAIGLIKKSLRRISALYNRANDKHISPVLRSNNENGNEFNSTWKRSTRATAATGTSALCYPWIPDPNSQHIIDISEWEREFNIWFCAKSKKAKNVKQYRIDILMFGIMAVLLFMSSLKYVVQVNTFAGSTFWHNILVDSALHNGKMSEETYKKKMKKKWDSNRMEIQYFRQNVLSFILTNVLWIYE